MSDVNTGRALATAIHETLSGHNAIKSVMGDPARLYDDAPDDPIFPYLTYGAIRMEDESADDAPLTAHIMTLHIWSRYGGRAEVFDLLHVVSSALRAANLNPAGLNICSINILYSDVFRTSDRRTLHGVLRLSIKTQPKLLPYEEAV